MKRPGLLATMLWPLVATLVVGSVALGLFVSRAVEADLIATTDDELSRAIAVRLDPRPGPDARTAGVDRPPARARGAGSVDDERGDIADGQIPQPVADASEPASSADGVDSASESASGSGADGGESESESDTDGAESDAPIELVVAPDGTFPALSPRVEPLLDAGLRALIDDVRSDPAGDVLVSLEADIRYRVLLRPTPDGRTLVVGLPLDQVDRSLDSLQSNLLLGGVVLFGVQALIVFGLTRLVNRPVVRLSATAHRIAGGDLDADVGPPSGPRETAALTDDLGVMLERLRATIGERERAAADAERSRRDMERFMADASHELRTPLTAIRGYSDLYRSDMLDPADVDRVMGRIGSESERLTALVGDLLDMVRPADRNRSDPVDLGAVASAVVHDLRAANPDHRLTLDLVSAPRADAVAVSDAGAGAGAGAIATVGDAARLHQAVLNLGANACQHTPPGSSIEVSVAAEGSDAVVRVVDDGPGIAADDVEAVFRPFSRGDESRSRLSHDGAGLGLALVKRIAERHDGTVTHEPTAGGGATFVLRLPLLASSPDQPT